MNSCRVALVLVLVVGTCMMSPRAEAQSAADVAVADKLFKEAVPLMESGDFEAAARKLEASHELDPAFETAMNLAACYEVLGKVASAWARYREAATMAGRQDDTTRRREASKRADGLEQDLPMVVVEVHARTRAIPGLRITRGGQPVAPQLFGTAIPVDPGRYEVEAAAPGYETLSIRIDATRGESVTVKVPDLQANSVAAGAAVETEDRSLDDHEGGGGSTRRRVGWVFVATGATAMVAGVGFGVSAVIKDNDAPSGSAEQETARRHANIGTVLLATGLVLTATGVVVLWRARRSGTSAAVAPVVAPDRTVGLQITGRF